MQEPVRVLYVDDSPCDRELVRKSLEREEGRFRLTEVESREAFESKLTDRFDIVLSDCSIPGFDGLQIIDAVHRVYPDMPVIIVTGKGSEEVAVEVIKRGAVAPPRSPHFTSRISQCRENRSRETS